MNYLRVRGWHKVVANGWATSFIVDNIAGVTMTTVTAINRIDIWL